MRRIPKTEKEWLQCTFPSLLLELISERVTTRKIRLFACGCCRLVWNVLPPSFQRGIENIEQVAEELAVESDLKHRQLYCPDLSLDITWLTGKKPLGRIPSFLTRISQIAVATAPTLEGGVYVNHLQAQADILRDLVGNPFVPITIPSEWLNWKDQTVVKLATVISQQAQWEDMPILGDALEESGCNDERILNHCREETWHGPGCHVIDALLQRL